MKEIVRRFKAASFLVQISERKQSYAEKRGGVVYVQICVCISSDVGIMQPILKIPEEFLPARDKEFVAFADFNPVHARIKRNGELSVDREIRAGSWLFANITYLAREEKI